MGFDRDVCGDLTLLCTSCSFAMNHSFLLTVRVTAVVSGQRVARVPGIVLGSGDSIAEGPAGGAAGSRGCFSSCVVEGTGALGVMWVAQVHLGSALPKSSFYSKCF